MKITIDPELKGKALFDFLKANKEALIAEKKSMPIKYSDVLQHNPTVKKYSLKTNAIKDDLQNTEDPTDPNKIHVTAVANVFLYMDSQYDVLIPGCCKRTLQARAGKFVQLHDHIYKIEAKIGEVTEVYTQNVSLQQLGLSKPGNVESLIFEFDAIKSYNEQIFNQYLAGKVDQYSIGLQYVTIDLAINDPDSPKEIAFWNKYIGQIINQDAAIEAGFFFVVTEIKLLENSAVLFGANDLTMTLNTSSAKSITFASKKELSLEKLQKKASKLIDTINEFEALDGTDEASKEILKGMTKILKSYTDKINEMLNNSDRPTDDIQETDPSREVIEFDLSEAIKNTKFLN